MGAGHKLTGLVIETTAVQMIASMAVLIIPALAPEIAPDLGEPPGRIGFQVGLLYLAGTISSLFAGNAVRRFGGAPEGFAFIPLGGRTSNLKAHPAA